MHFKFLIVETTNSNSPNNKRHITAELVVGCWVKWDKEGEGQQGDTGVSG